MPVKEVSVNHLRYYLPGGTTERVVTLLQQYRVHLRITRERRSVLGMYRHLPRHGIHQISINGNLNAFSFLITLLHELAHLVCYEQHARSVPPHGREWQQLYAGLLKQFLQQQIFPPDVEAELSRTLNKPGAAACAEEDLMRVLKKYDDKAGGQVLVEELPEGAFFTFRDGRIFQKGEKLRKRYKCTEHKTGKLYLFSALCEVLPFSTH